MTHISLPGAEDITRATLPGGITLLCRVNPHSATASFHGYLHSGSLADPDDKLGLAYFTSAALMRGTEKHSFESIFNELESVGAVLGFSSGTHTTGFSGRALSEDMPLLFDLLAECLRQPTFPVDEIERLRSQWLTSLSMRAQDTADRAGLAFDRLIYSNHPYARPEDGYPETARAIQRDDLLRHHQRTFGPNGLTIAVVGGINPSQVIDMVSKALEGWNMPQEAMPALPEVPPLTAPTREDIPLAGKSQTDLIAGVLGPRRSDPEYIPASLGNSVLGQFGMMGRIGDVLREQSGLAYFASSSVGGGIGPGTWEISAGVNPSNVEKALELITLELQKFVNHGISADELRDVQDQFVGRLPLTLESNAGVAHSLINIERNHLGLDYYRHYESMIRAVTPEMVHAAIKKYIHPEALAIATCGTPIA